MAGLLVLIIMIGCAAYFFLKSTFVKSFAFVMAAIGSTFAAFGYYELLANVFLNHREDNSYTAIVPWAQPLSFVLLFILVFAILQTIVTQLTLKNTIDLGTLPEQIGRAVCGLIFGMILAGVLLTALAMGPLPDQYPYQRFDPSAANADNPNGVFFNPDSFVSGLFSLVSRGSLSGQTSFASVHPGFINEAFLNRLSQAPVLTPNKGIDVPKKEAAWLAPEGLNYAAEPNQQARPVEAKSGHTLVIVRAGITKNSFREAAEFSTSQLRIICMEKDKMENPASAKSVAVYPIGYLVPAKQAEGKAPVELQAKNLGDMIKIVRADFAADVKYIDWVAYLPSDYVPVAVAFKQNNLETITPKLAQWPDNQQTETLTKPAAPKPAEPAPAEPNAAAPAQEPDSAEDANAAADTNDANSAEQ